MEMHLDIFVGVEVMDCSRGTVLHEALPVHIPGYIQHSMKYSPALQ